MSKYLYGASVQGIQGFIFKTNKLQEIVGASEIVKSVADEFLVLSNYREDDERILLNAAGNIKAVFDTEEECRNVVLNFAKRIQKKAYGITILQAVVAFDREAVDVIDVLEQKLKTQRNRPPLPLDMSINIMKLNPRTARPLIDKENDMATKMKLDANKKFYEKNPHVKKFKDFSYISNNKNKLAIIHIDGNGLGQIVPKLGKKLSAFSRKLDTATKEAVRDAKDETMHIREVVVGGDDVTVICNANDALTFTRNFLVNFETNTQKIEELKGIATGLTACAGIAYCNEKYPFHYAVSLAEELCGVAKKHANRKASSLMFHNIQSSNYQTWENFVEDELTIRNEQRTIRCDFGPYYLNKEGEVGIENLLHTVEAYRCDGSPIGKLRNWLSELYKSDTNAKLLLHRINQIVKEKKNWNCSIMDRNLKFFNKNLSNDTLIVQKDNKEKTPIYDILQILSVTEGR